MPTDSERLAMLERDMKHVCEAVERIDGKLDTFASTKADATYVQAVDSRVTELRGWLWGLVIAVGLSMLGTIGAVFVLLVKTR